MPPFSFAALTTVLASIALPHAPSVDDAIAPETFALVDYDAELPLDIQEVGSEPYDGYDIIDLTYASPMGGRVPAYLYMPHDESRQAGMLLMHGMPGDRSNSARLARQYVEAGAVVLAISAPWARTETPVPMSFTEQDRANQIQLIQDLRRGVDLLLTFPRVDPERLGYLGISYGGAMGGLLAGVEHRIKAYVLAVGDGGLLAHMTSPGDTIPPNGVTDEQWEQWVSDMDPIEPLRFVAHAAPSELLFQNGREDQLVPAADAEVYQAAGSEPKTVQWYPDGHRMTGERLFAQAQWLSERIGIDPKPFRVPGAPPVGGS